MFLGFLVEVVSFSIVFGIFECINLMDKLMETIYDQYGGGCAETLERV